MATYEWIDPYAWDDAGVYTLVRGRAPDAVLKTFGAEGSALETISLAEVPWDAPNGRWVALLPDGQPDWTVIAEHGTAFAGQDLVADLSADGTAVCCSIVVGSVTLQVAEDGQLVRMLDAWAYDPAGALPEETGLDLGGVDRPRAVATLVERLTGVAFAPHWFVGPFAADWVALT